MELIEEFGKFKLPKNYETLVDTTINYGFIGEDFEIIIELQLDSIEFNGILKHISDWKMDEGKYVKSSTNGNKIKKLVINPQNRMLSFMHTNL